MTTVLPKHINWLSIYNCGVFRTMRKPVIPLTLVLALNIIRICKYQVDTLSQWHYTFSDGKVDNLRRYCSQTVV
jgi:hypothetical protein